MSSSDDAIDARPSRRAVLAGATGLFGALAGCTALGGGGSGDSSGSGSEDGGAATDGSDGGEETGSEDGAADGSGTATDADGEDGSGSDATAAGPPTLRVGGNGTVLDIVQAAVTDWNENPPPEEGGFGDWVPAAYDIETDHALADYFAVEYGFETTGERTHPPFLVAVAGGSTIEAGSDLERGDVDLAATGATPIEPSAPDRLDTASFVEHSIGRTGSVFLVSPAIARADVALRPEEIRAIYADEITNWRAVGGPDREIAVVTGAASSPPRAIEQRFFRDVVMEGLEARFGRPQNRVEYLAERNDAIADAPVRRRFPDSGPRPVEAIVDGERRTFREPGYPGMQPLRLYSDGEPGDREQALLDFLQSPVVQQEYVPRDRVLPLESEA